MKTKLTAVERISRILLAVLAGFIIWGSAVDTEVFQVEARLPLNLAAADGHGILSMSAESVSVTFTGSGWEMLSFQIQGLPSSLDASYQAEPGSGFPRVFEIEFNPETIDPEGPVVAERITPSRITCTVDTLISRRIPAAPVFTDGIPARFRFVSVEPAFITISGPATLVLRRDSVQTEAVQPGSSPYFSSLAPGGEMVAYSSDSVKVLVFDPVMPSLNTAVGSEGLLTP